MKWQVAIYGNVHDKTFPTEDEANQFAANERGNDWAKKIEVKDLDAPAPVAPLKPNEPTPLAPSPNTATLSTDEPARGYGGGKQHR